MKYTCEIEINKPIDKVVKLFNDPDNLGKWMDGLQSIEYLEGEPGQPGSKSKMIFKMNNKDVEMIETIAANNLPDVFSATYDANGVHNIQKSKFVRIDENKTKYIAENEFQFNGFMKLMTLMPGAFKKQSMKYLKSFKDFVEKES